MPYDPQKHHRRSIRLKGYDYTQPGAYFVTLVAYQRANIFGEVVDGEMHLNDYGNIARQQWEKLPRRFPEIVLDAFVVMPNHVHGILVIVDPASAHDAVGDSAVGAQRVIPENDEIEDLPLRPSINARPPHDLAAPIIHDTRLYDSTADLIGVDPAVGAISVDPAIGDSAVGAQRVIPENDEIEDSPLRPYIDTRPPHDLAAPPSIDARPSHDLAAPPSIDAHPPHDLAAPPIHDTRLYDSTADLIGVDPAVGAISADPAIGDSAVGAQRVIPENDEIEDSPLRPYHDTRPPHDLAAPSIHDVRPSHDLAAPPIHDTRPPHDLAAPPSIAAHPAVIPSSLGAIVRAYKSAVAYRLHRLRLAWEGPVWQRNYYEHILRHRAGLERVRQYIHNNPRRWSEDQLHPHAAPNRFNQD